MKFRISQAMGAVAVLAVGAAVSFGVAPAYAGWVDPTVTVNGGVASFQFLDKQGDTVTVSFTPYSTSTSTLTEVLDYEPNLGANNVSSILTDVQAAGVDPDGVNPWSSVTLADFVGRCENVGSCSDSSSTSTNNPSGVKDLVTSQGVSWTASGNTNTFSIITNGAASPGFDFLDIHGGNFDYFFTWSSPIDSFSISGTPTGVSSITAFWPEPPTDAPAPGALSLLGLGLLGLGAMMRRRSTSAV